MFYFLHGNELSAMVEFSQVSQKELSSIVVRLNKHQLACFN